MRNHDLPLDARQIERGLVLRLGRGIQNVAQPVDGDLHLLEILPDLRQPQHRLRDLARDHAEGHEFAHRKLAVDHRLGAEQEQRGIGKLLNILNGARSTRADKPGVEGGRDIGRELFFPLRLHGGLDGRSFDGLDADDGLDQHLLAFGAPVELLLDLLAQGRAHKGSDQKVKRDRKQNDQAELPGIGQQHRDEHEGEEQIDRRKQPLAGEEGADGLKLPHARDRLARGAGLEIGSSADETGARRGGAQARHRCGSSCARARKFANIAAPRRTGR